MTETTRRRGDRHDATRVDLGRGFKAIFPYLMKGRNESIAYYPVLVDAEPLLAYLEQKKGTEQQITVFEAFLLALVRILRERPTLNRYFIGRRLYQRRNVELSFVARRQYTDDTSEANVFVHVLPTDDTAAILRKIRGEIHTAKTDTTDDEALIGLFMRLPRGVLRAALKLLEWWDFYFDTPGFLRGIDPLRCSAYIANLGSVGMGAAYHHLFEWGTCSLFVTIGQIKPTVCVGDDGQPAVKRMVELRISLDERIADGYYDATALNLFDTYLRDPVELERL
jgi:hypothetical protein